jgi:hypothetical protein
MRKAGIVAFALLSLAALLMFIMPSRAPEPVVPDPPARASSPASNGGARLNTAAAEPDPEISPRQAVATLALSDPGAAGLVRELQAELLAPVSANAERRGEAELVFALPQDLELNEAAEWIVEVSIEFPPGFPEGWDQKVQVSPIPQVEGRTVNLGAIPVELPVFADNQFIITGRAICAGQPMPWQSLAFAVKGVTNARYIRGFADQNGRVFLPFRWNVERRGEPEQASWHVDPGLQGSDVWMAHHPLPAPTRVGRVLDFGDIELPGGILEIHAVTERGFPFTEGRLEVHLRSGSIVIVDGRWCVNGPWRGCVPSGVYTVRLELARNNGHFEPYHGWCEIKAGEVTHVEYVANPNPSVNVYVETADGFNPDAEVAWRVDGYYLRDKRGAVEQPVPMQLVNLDGDSRDLEIVGIVPGWKTKGVPYRPGMTEARIVLHEREYPPTTLTVVIPPAPDWLSDAKVSRVVVHIRGDWIPPRTHYMDHLKVDPYNEVSRKWTVADGKPLQIVIEGGMSFGFPMGIISGPHEYIPQAHIANEWRLHSWPDPPSTMPLKRRLTCDGRPIRLHVPVVYGDHWGEHGGGSAPVAYLDGDEVLPFKLGRDSDGNAVSELTLPARIKVHLPENHTPGRWIADAYLGADARIGQPGETDSTRAEFIDGESWLWLPRGPALVVARRDRQVVDHWRIDVTVSVQVLNVRESVPGTAKFEIRSDDPTLADRCAGWDFRVVTHVQGEQHRVSDGHELSLQPGTYALIAPDDLRADGVPFEIAAGETTLVRMNVEGAVAFDGELILKPPVAGGVEFPFFQYRLDMHSQRPFGTGKEPILEGSIFDGQPSRQVAQGLLIQELPRGAEFWLAGALGVGDRRWALIPQRVTLGDSTPALEGQWVELRRAERSWDLRGAFVCWESPAGPTVPTYHMQGVWSWRTCQPVGPARMTVRRHDGLVLHSFETDWAPGNEPVLLPPDVEARLAELGLLR